MNDYLIRDVFLKEPKKRGYYSHRSNLYGKGEYLYTIDRKIPRENRALGTAKHLDNQDYRKDFFAFTSECKVWTQVFKTSTLNYVYQKQFEDLAAKWKDDTGALSNLIKITKNKNYRLIIELGERMLPFILKDLEKTYDYWFTALQEITNKNPVPDEDFGNVKKMTEHWLKWGRQHKYVS